MNLIAWNKWNMYRGFPDIVLVMRFCDEIQVLRNAVTPIA